MENEKQPLEGEVKTELNDDVKEDHDETTEVWDLSDCIQTKEEPIEFNRTDAIRDRKTGLMVCLHCFEEIESSLLSEHMVTVHGYRKVQFKCHICQNTFQERKLLQIHRVKCKPDKYRKRKSFYQTMREVESQYFSEDQNEQSLEEPVSCPICMIEYPKHALKEHLNREHRKPEVILICDRCKRQFKSKLTLREHIKLVHDAVENSHECELCSQKFNSHKYLANHKRNVHPTGNKIHKCETCSKEFKSRLCLYQHTKYVHPPDSAAVHCPLCPNRIYKSKINLQQHLKVSHGWKKNMKISDL